MLLATWPSENESLVPVDKAIGSSTHSMRNMQLPENNDNAHTTREQKQEVVV